MPIIITPIAADVSRHNVFPSIIAKQYDSNSRFLNVTITNKDKKIPVDSGSIVIINARRPDNEAKAFAGIVNEDGTVTVPITNWILAQNGTVRCDITIVDGDSRKMTTTLFALNVEQSTYTGDDISEDDNYDLLVTLLAEVAEAQTAELGRVDAEEGRVSAESGRVSAETRRTSAESERVTAEQGRVSAEEARVSVESIMISQETARVEAEAARVSAETERETNSSTAVTNANNARDTALAAASEIALEDEDASKNYTYKLFVRNGYPGISFTEIPSGT